MRWILFLLLFVVACSSSGQVGECVFDADCVVGGCSGQICGSVDSDLVSTCEWLDAYSCYHEAAESGCGCVQGVCQWSEAVQSCVVEYPDVNY